MTSATSAKATDAHRHAKPTAADLRAARALKALWEARPDRQAVNQQTVADLLDISQSAVSQYIHGRIPLNFLAVSAFATALECDPSEIRDDLREQRLARIESRQLAKAMQLVGEAYSREGRHPTANQFAKGIAFAYHRLTHTLGHHVAERDVPNQVAGWVREIGERYE